MTQARLRLPPVTIEAAERGAKKVLEGASKALGMIPNMYANMANAPELLETYAVGYNGFRAHSGLSAAEQEIVLLSVSYENACTYCMAAHSFMADHVSGVPTHVTDAIRDGAPIEDPRLRALSELTRELVRTRGWPSEVHVSAFLSAGYTEEQLLYVLLAVAVKTISNYANHLFATPLDTAFKARAWRAPR